MKNGMRIALAAAVVAAATAVLAPAPALADGGCVGLIGHCKTIWFDVCANGVCTPTSVDLVGEETPE